MATDHDRQQAQRQAADHRRRAGELFADHAREQDPGKQRELLSQAQHENAEAVRWEKAAGHQTREAGGNRQTVQEKQEDSFSRDGEAASDSDRRTWYLPGSVADDKILQAEEAQQGSLMGELVKYAARSVVDKDHRTFEGAKLVGKAASIPAKGAAHAGKAAAFSSARRRPRRRVLACRPFLRTCKTNDSMKTMVAEFQKLEHELLKIGSRGSRETSPPPA